MTTAAARMPKAIHPHWVVLLDSSLLFEAAAAPAAAAAAGFTPEVVVALVVVTTADVVTVTAGAIDVSVTVDDVVCVIVTVFVGACTVWVGGGWVVVTGVDWVGVESVGMVRVAPVRVPVAELPPLPHAVSATAATNPKHAVAKSAAPLRTQTGREESATMSDFDRIAPATAALSDDVRSAYPPAGDPAVHHPFGMNAARARATVRCGARRLAWDGAYVATNRLAVRAARVNRPVRETPEALT
ncbi:MAG TPA: hypothetical protein VH108_06035 [Gaiellaceae bacterium]|jgi:hypothetical protein|nr:hypothetical protein [Gaiellaceae bacterium]